MGSSFGCRPPCCSQDHQEPPTNAETVNVFTTPSGPTDCEAQFPTMCLPMPLFMTLQGMQPYEALLDKLIEPEEDIVVHFISHEWLGFTHPDPECKQLRRMQHIFQIFLDGKAHQLFETRDWDAFLTGVSAGTSHAVRGIEGSVVKRARFTDDDLVQHVRDGCVWLDYHSIPQHSKDEQFIKAVSSIPYYVERSNYFWICAPHATHKELKEPRDFLSWRRRGWCRMEEMIRFLSRTLKMPLIVTNQATISTYGFFDGMVLYMGRPERSVFNGTFTCCQLNHQAQQPDGTIVKIPCDKDTIGPVLSHAFEAFFTMPSKEQIFRTNMLKQLGRYMFAGYEAEEKRFKPDPDEMLEAFLARTGYKSLDELDGMGSPPMAWAMSLADIKVVKEIHRQRPDQIYARSRVANMSVLSFSMFIEPKFYREMLSLYKPAELEEMLNRRTDAGHLPLEQAARNGFTANASCMIDAKADVEARRKDNGATSLLSAAQHGYPECCQMLLSYRADVHTVDSRGFTALHHAADPLAVVGNPEANAKLEVIEVLLQARASVDAVDEKGRTPLQVAEELECHAVVNLLSAQKNA